MWFQEALCELASIWGLRVMGGHWMAGNAPYWNWNDWGVNLVIYGDSLTNGVQTFATAASFRTWLDSKLPAMEANATIRDFNNIVATHLLPLFDEQPLAWQAVPYLNAGQQVNSTFQEHLQQWYDATPRNIRHHVAAVAHRLGYPVQEPPPPTMMILRW